MRSTNGQTVKGLADVRIAMEMTDPQRVDPLRGRLASGSFFMGALCEHIARRSNLEDRCGGRFWESRFKCELTLEEGLAAVKLAGDFRICASNRCDWHIRCPMASFGRQAIRANSAWYPLP